MIQFYWYPKCSTCRKAKKWLDEHQVEYGTIDMIQNIPSAEQLKKWLEESSLPVRRFFNTSGKLYRESGLKERIDEMTTDELAAELAKNGMMIRRPILDNGHEVTLGFKEEAFQHIVEGE